MKLKLYKYYNPYTWKGWWHFVLVVPKCVNDQHDELIGLTAGEKKSRKGCILCYERTNYGKEGDDIPNDLRPRWYGPHYVAEHTLQPSTQLDFLLHEGMDLLKSLPPAIRRLYEKET